MCRIKSYCLGLFLWLPGILTAQYVIYADNYGIRSSISTEVVGKSGDDYWTLNQRKQRTKNRSDVSAKPAIESFGLYNAKLNLIRELVPAELPAKPLKQWLLAGKNSLDQVMLIPSAQKTNVICSRYYTIEGREPELIPVGSLPLSVHPSSFLLLRSNDQSKILLIAFENKDATYTRVYADLFDADWKPIYHKVFASEQFSQPCIQDEDISFPVEGFDNLPVKLADNGEWLMAYPSRVSRNLSVFHACANGDDYYFTEIPVSPYYKMEDIAMSISSDQEDISLGLLSGYLNTTLKNVQVSDYSMKKGRFDFDTSYHFNTGLHELHSKKLSRDRFMAVSGGGYLLCKEYSIPLESKKEDIPLMSPFETAYLLANYTEPDPGNRELRSGYSFNHGLSPIPIIRRRGDLNLFYFPSTAKDSTWSGFIDMEQHTELNNPELSYLFIPVKNRLYIIYNSADESSDPLPSVITLNSQGRLEENSLICWKMKNTMNFQQARRISENEIAVPCSQNVQNRFAIIRF